MTSIKTPDTNARQPATAVSTWPIRQAGLVPLTFAGLSLLGLAALAAVLLFQPGYPAPVATGTFLNMLTAVEMFSAVVAWMICVTGYRALFSNRAGAVVVLGLCFLAVGAYDVLHALSQVGMPDLLTPNSEQKALLFRLSASATQAGALLLYVRMPSTRMPSPAERQTGLIVVVAVVCGVSWHLAAAPQSVPLQLVMAGNLTNQYVILQWTVVALHLAAFAILLRRRRMLSGEHLTALTFALALAIASEAFLAADHGAQPDLVDLMGHAYRLFAYLFLFHATASEALRRPIERLNAQLRREMAIMESAPEGVLVLDDRGIILQASASMRILAQVEPHLLVGQGVDVLVPPALRAGHADHVRRYFAAPHTRPMGQRNHLQLWRPDGSTLAVDIGIGHWHDESGRALAVAFLRDVSERQRHEEELRRQATHDALTGLPNRWLLRHHLHQSLERSARHPERGAVMMLDLDDFKHVNDAFGHPVGDQLLVAVAKRLAGCLRTTDTLARLGGDEFAVLVDDVSSIDDVTMVADRLIASMAQPHHLGALELACGVSIGIAVHPEDGADVDDLLAKADVAMYQAKRAGRGRYAFHTDEMNERAHEDLRISVRLRHAIEDDTLTLHYQPQIDVRSGRIIGAEALLRWFDSELGQVSPARFIPVAESTGLILPISDWVLSKACQQIAAWQHAGCPLKVAVNLSAQQLHHARVAERIATLIEERSIDPKLLEVEITETSAMQHPEEAKRQLERISGLGVSVALDDFGTGYSSLTYLKNLPISKLKIDRSFVKNLPERAEDAVIVRAILAMVRRLGIFSMAEGVETDEQLLFLRGAGCQGYQGWLHGRPMPADELTRRLHDASAVTGVEAP